MAVLRQRLSKRLPDGSFTPVHFETSSEIVVRPDGTSIETTVSKIVEDIEAIQQDFSPAGIGAAPANHTHTAADVGALPSTTVIPDKVSQLTNDKNYTTDAQVDEKVSAMAATIIGGAPEDYDTLKEVYDKIKENDDARTALNAAIAGKVDKTRTVNGKPLSADVTLDAADVGARPATWTPTAADVGARPATWTPTAADVGALPSGGTAAKATVLATARTFRVNLGSASTASFDGSGNVTPGVTGTLPVANGGTGVTSTAALKTALGISTWGDYMLEDLPAAK